MIYLTNKQMLMNVTEIMNDVIYSLCSKIVNVNNWYVDTAAIHHLCIAQVTIIFLTIEI